MAHAYLWSRFWKEKQKIQKGPNQRTLIYSKWPQLLKISLKTYIFLYMKIKRGLQTIIIIVCTGYDDVTFMAFLYKKQPYKSKKKKDQICYIIKGTLWKLFFTTEKQGRYSHDKILNYLQIFWVVMSKFQLLSQSWNSGISKLQFWNTKKFWLMHSSYYCCCCCYYNYIVLFFSVVEAKFNSIWIPQFFRFFHLLLFPDVMTFYLYFMVWVFLHIWGTEDRDPC